MCELMADIVGLLNDIYSAPKEFDELKKRVAANGGNPDNEQDLKRFVTSNLVLIKWRDGMSLKEAVQYTNDKYREKLQSYMQLRQKAVQEVKEHDAEAQATVVAIDGWVSGHPVWALNSGRYTKAQAMSVEKVGEFLRMVRAS
jgi:hypothetical protein